VFTHSVPAGNRSLVLSAVGLVALFALLCALSWPALADSRTRSCGSTKVGSLRLFNIRVERGSASCKMAKKLLRGLYTGKGTKHGSSGADSYTALYGWHCSAGAGGAVCIKGGGWTYDTARQRISAEN
jgi:hypothetical protein